MRSVDFTIELKIKVDNLFILNDEINYNLFIYLLKLLYFFFEIVDLVKIKSLFLTKLECWNNWYLWITFITFWCDEIRYNLLMFYYLKKKNLLMVVHRINVFSNIVLCYTSNWMDLTEIVNEFDIIPEIVFNIPMSNNLIFDYYSTLTTK